MYSSNCVHPIEYVSFDELMKWCCMDIEDVCKLTHKTKKTIYKYIKTNKPSYETRKLLEWYSYGIPQINNWKYWRIRNGKLINPSGYEYDDRHLDMIPVLYTWYLSQRHEEKQAKHKNKRRILGG